jgi:hypothetical protein
MTPSGIGPATFRLVAQCLDQLRHRVHRHFLVVNPEIYETPKNRSQIFWVDQLRSAELGGTTSQQVLAICLVS